MFPCYWLHQDFPAARLQRPGADLDRSRGDFERLLRHRSPGTTEYPPLNVWANDDGAVVTFEIPGVKPDQLDISVSGGTVVVRGERGGPVDPDALVHRRERFQGKFSRTLDLPFQIAAGQVEARCENGILEVRLPRAESDKPRKIVVQ